MAKKVNFTTIIPASESCEYQAKVLDLCRYETRDRQKKPKPRIERYKDRQRYRERERQRNTGKWI